MAHFAQLDQNKIITRVLVVHDNDAPTEATGIAFLEKLTGETGWVQTSFNTRAGENKEVGKPFRGTYAGVGFTYDPGLDVFLPPKPYPSWSATDKGTWESPVLHPKDGKPYAWDEPTQIWKEIN
jgi:hypothetical protein